MSAADKQDSQENVFGTSEKYIHLRIMRERKDWQRLFYKMAEGDISRYEAIKGLDVFEFWTLFDEWQKKNAPQK